MNELTEEGNRKRKRSDSKEIPSPNQKKSEIRNNENLTSKFRNEPPTTSGNTNLVLKRKFEFETNGDGWKKSKIVDNFDNSDFQVYESGDNAFVGHPKYFKSDPFFSEEKKCSYELFKRQDLYYYLIDEVALEGLDGITIEALWKRLQSVFPIILSNETKELLWRLLCNNKRIEFYELEEPRDELITYDQYKYMDYDLDAFPEPPDQIKEIYPFSPVNDPKIKGSCATFSTRKKLEEINHLSLEQVLEKYDRKLVIVADQALRSKAIISEESDPLVECTNLEYCMLERIGRSRQHGELTKGKLSLNAFFKDAKSLYHHNKALKDNFLITFQHFHTKSYNTSMQIQSRCLIQLPRFHNPRKSKYLLIVEKIAEILRQQPNNQIELSELKNRIFNSNVSIKNVLKRTEFQNYFSSLIYNYRQLYPNATRKEWLCKAGHKEKEVRALKMNDPTVNVSANFDLKLNPHPTKFVPEPINNKRSIVTYQGNIRDAYQNILEGEGVTLMEITDNLQNDFYMTRQALKKLQSCSLIDSYRVDIGRQQTAKFFTRSRENKVEKPRRKNQGIKELRKKVLLHFSSRIREIGVGQTGKEKRGKEVSGVVESEARTGSKAERFDKAVTDSAELDDNEANIDSNQRQNREAVIELPGTSDNEVIIDSKQRQNREALKNSEQSLNRDVVIGCPETSDNAAIIDFKQRQNREALIKSTEIRENEAIINFTQRQNRQTLIESPEISDNATLIDSKQKNNRETLIDSTELSYNDFVIDLKAIKNCVSDSHNKETVVIASDQNRESLIESTEITNRESITDSKEESDIYESDEGNFESRMYIYDSFLLKDSNLFEEIADLNIPPDFFETNEPPIIKPAQPIKIDQIKSNYRNPHSSKRIDDYVTKACLINALLTGKDKISDDLADFENKFNNKQSESDTNIEKSIDNSKIVNIPTPKTERFMGINPKLVYHDITTDNIIIEIYESTESLKTRDDLLKYSNDNSIIMTKRTINRLNFIIKLIHNEKLIKFDYLFKMIRNDELQKGYYDEICRKTMKKLLVGLIDDGYMKVFYLVVKNSNLIRSQHFVCSLNVSFKHPTIKSEIEQFKMKLFATIFTDSSTNRDNLTIVKKEMKPIKVKSSPFNSSDVRNSILQLETFNKVSMTDIYRYDRSIGKRLGYRPKFVRMRILHEFLFYLVYELCESKPLNRLQQNQLLSNYLVNSNDLPSIYRNEINWKMFIPALPNHKGWPNGWFLACDMILRLPLSIFLKLYNVCYVIPELDDYIYDPIKQHLLIKNLPSKLRSVLLNRGKYFQSIYDTILNLCYIGLLQFGPKKFKDREQIFFYLNKHASLLDTITSTPGYNHIEKKKYKKLRFTFQNEEEVERYWRQMWEICMKTRLGKRKIMDGKSVVIESANSKPSLIKALRVKTSLQAPEFDKGKIPGDHRGAAGLDSALWAYMKRNWCWNSKFTKSPTTSTTNQNEGIIDDNLIIKSIKYEDFQKQNKIDPKPSSKIETTKPRRYSSKPQKHIAIIRTITNPKSCYVRKYYDSVDKSIMKDSLRLKRAEWSLVEDRILCLSKSIITFLCRNCKKTISYTVVRDVLHRINPSSSLNKTSKACQRRVMILMSDDHLQIMNSNVENLLNSSEISKYFHKLFYRYKDDSCKLKDSDLSIAFIYLMSYLMKNLNEFESLLLGYVATIDYFSKSYRVLFEFVLNHLLPVENLSKYYRNPCDRSEIKKDVVKSIVHSSLISKTNDMNWTCHLFNVYRNFSDELIRNVIGDLKRIQLIITTKSGIYGGKEPDISWQTPVHLSHLYNLMMSSPTYPQNFFENPYRKLISIILSNQPDQYNFICLNELNSFYSNGIEFRFNIPEIGTILNPNLVDHNEVIEELSIRFHLLLKTVYDRECDRRNELSIDSNQLDDLNTKTSDDVQSEGDKEEELVKLKNYVMELIFRVPYFVEGNLENYFKQLMNSVDDSEISELIRLIIKEIIKQTENDERINDCNPSFLKELDNADLTKDQLTAILSKVVYNIQNSLKEKYNETNSHEDKDEEFEKIDNAEINEPTITIQTKDLDPDQQLRQLPFIPGIVIDSRNIHNGMSYCIRKALTGDIPTLDEIKTGIMKRIEPDQRREIPHITDLNILLTKELFPQLDTDEETLERFKEHFVMQYPTLDAVIIDDLNDLKEHYLIKYLNEKILFEEMHQKILRDCVIKQPKLDRILEFVSNHEDLDFVEALIDFIKSKEEFGASSDELKDKFTSTNQTRLNLIDVLEFLMEINAILRTGIVSFTFVHYEFQSVWLLENLSRNNDEDEMMEIEEIDLTKEDESCLGLDQIYIRVMPWIRLDGSLNGDVFDRWLCTLLSHCLDFPNIQFRALCDKFCYLKPVDIYYLLEKLQELGCIELLLNPKCVNSLFSEPNIVESSALATFLDDFEDMYISINNISVLSMSSYLNSKTVKLC